MKSIAFIIKTNNDSFVGMNKIIVTRLHLAIMYSDEMFAKSEMDDIKRDFKNTDYTFEIKKVEVSMID